MPREEGRKLVAQNKRARHDYHVDDWYKAGLVLMGTEVKSVRAGRANLTEATLSSATVEVARRGSHSPSTHRGRGPTARPAVPVSCCSIAVRSAN